MNEAAPVQTITPATSYARTPLPADGTCLFTSEGVEMIPDPIWRLPTRAGQFRYVKDPGVGFAQLRSGQIRGSSSSADDVLNERRICTPSNGAVGSIGSS